MRWVRERLGVLTTVWLSCQALSLSALAPRNCCPAHSAHDHGASVAAADDEDCHAAVAVDDQCPMAAANGEACAMHRSSAGGASAAADVVTSHESHHHDVATTVAAGAHAETKPVPADCAMQSTCNGPAAALASLIWVPGVLGDSSAGLAIHEASLTHGLAPSTLEGIFELTLPPPRG